MSIPKEPWINSAQAFSLERKRSPSGHQTLNILRENLQDTAGLFRDQLRNRTWKGKKPSIKQRRGDEMGKTNTGGRRGEGSSGLAGEAEKKMTVKTGNTKGLGM